MEPSVKAGVVRTVLADLQALVAQGDVSRAELESALGAEALSIVLDDVPDSAWVSIRSYEQIYLLLARHEASGGSPEYFRRRGADNAHRLIGLGVYQQIKFVQRASGKPRVDGMLASLRLTATLWNSVYSFGEFEVLSGATPNEMQIVVKDAAPLPDFVWNGVAGFVERLMQEAGPRLSLSWRAHASGAVFTVTWSPSVPP